MAVWIKTSYTPTAELGTGIDVWTVDCFRKLLDPFFNSWECPLVEKEYIEDDARTNLIIADDTILSYRYYQYGCELYVNDEYYTTIASRTGKITIWICFSDTFFYLAHQLSESRKFSYLYEIIGDDIDAKAYEGWSQGNYLQSLKIKEKDSEDEQEYTHGILLNYKTRFRTIDYNDSYLFIGDKITNIVDSNFLSCSTVPADTILSFNEARHYSLDTNILVEIDPVEPYEEEGKESEDEEM